MTHTPLSSGSTDTNRHGRALQRRALEVCRPVGVVRLLRFIKDQANSTPHSPTCKVPPEMKARRLNRADGHVATPA
eukprot:511167-Prymnesium_polylepis.1